MATHQQPETSAEDDAGVGNSELGGRLKRLDTELGGRLNALKDRVTIISLSTLAKSLERLTM